MIQQNFSDGSFNVEDDVARRRANPMSQGDFRMRDGDSLAQARGGIGETTARNSVARNQNDAIRHMAQSQQTPVDPTREKPRLASYGGDRPSLSRPQIQSGGGDMRSRWAQYNQTRGKLGMGQLNQARDSYNTDKKIK